jgi:hypothetical protein
VSLAEDFDTWWAGVWRKVGKLDAFREYAKARRIDSAENILAGLDRYLQHMPDDPKYRPHPATWLHKGRWVDEYEDTPVQATAKLDWYAECGETHNHECGLNQQRHAQRKWAEAYKARESA